MKTELIFCVPTESHHVCGFIFKVDMIDAGIDFWFPVRPTKRQIRQAKRITRKKYDVNEI